MAGNALIGALRVSLGLDSAQFEAGLKNAQVGLGKFGKFAGTAFAAVTVAATAAGAALAVAVKGAIDNADALSKAAQKIGVTTEALSRLQFAANLSDVSLEQLTAGLGRLSKSMLDVATGSKGPAAAAFSALGISVKDAAGELRSSDAVFADIADRFSRLEDGAMKTALAQRIFGKSGAELIPLLNAGRDGLREMANESDRLGNTISTTTGRAAEQFNDNLTRMQAALDGLVNKVMEAALPALVSLTNTMASAEFQGAVATTIGLIAGLADVLARTAVLAAEVANILPKAIAPSEDDAVAAMNADFAKMGAEEFKRKYGLGDQYAAGATGGLPGAALPAIDVKPMTVDMDALSASTEKTKHVFGDFLDKVNAGQQVFEATRTSFEQLQIDLGNLDQQLKDGVISWDTYGRASSQAVAGAAASALGSIANLSSGLSAAFEDNKTLAIATAVLKGAESVASSFAAGSALGGPLVGAAFAGVAAITAAANVAAVAATTPTSKSMSASAPAASAPTAPAAQQAAGPSVYVQLEGERFGRSQIENLIKEINSAVGDGVRLQVS